jgi:hypothetical protein
MALIIKDRVQEVSTTVGTIPMVLGGAPTNFVTFGSVMTNGDTCYYAIISATDWEVGLGTYASGTNSLARNTVYGSSNANSFVNFGAGTKYVYIDAAADRILMKDANNTINSPTFSGSLAGTPTAASSSSFATQVVQVDFGNYADNAFHTYITISTDLWNATSIVMAAPYAGVTSPDNGSLTDDEYEMDSFFVAAHKGSTTGQIGLYINAGTSFIAGKRNIALKLF